ncbi:MAG: phenylalanine--tRNA ligase subunit alpha [Clostridia bacterium]|nr:phenylalanine--tRNA ligase subunit alpha [Clostridia bacterium]
MNIQENIDHLLEHLQADLCEVVDSQTLEALRLRVLGRKGEITTLMRVLGQVPPEERPAIGQLINDAREKAAGWLDTLAMRIAVHERTEALARETIDVTQPMWERRLGNLHPINLALDEILDVFTGMGFEAVEGPEVELDLYNFELLNLPKNHPSRDAQDTFYIEENIVLRTHTSPVQARTMLERKPPIRIVCPGRVYRADEFDATHSPVFHQLEGLMIDEDVTMGDLKGTLDAFAKRLYDPDIATRFRPSFFPFTEPSAEVDLTCVSCRGQGCRVCKGTGWIEVLGAGMVNPKVLELCGIDSQKYSGFAFGMGLDRIALLRYGVQDLRLMFEGDMRFLRQFR